MACHMFSARPRPNRRHFAGDIFKCNFENENGPGDKPLSEPMMVSLLMHICVTRPQWVKQCSHTVNIQIFYKCIRKECVPNQAIIYIYLYLITIFSQTCLLGWVSSSSSNLCLWLSKQLSPVKYFLCWGPPLSLSQLKQIFFEIYVW